MSSPSGSLYSDVETPGNSRPNRWTGNPSTWLSVTEQERGLATSLDALRDKDLAVHLYNAHALKKGAEAGVVSLVTSAKISHMLIDLASENPDDDDADDPFVPPKSWTAWPLPADQVPREGETVGEEDINEEFTFKRRQEETSSERLEDILLGLSLRSAKERFELRQWADQEDDAEVHVDKPREAPEVIDDVDEEPVTKEELVPLQASTYLKPVVAADDETSRKILQPTIRNTISKLDDLLMILHHTRRTCRQYSLHSAHETDGEDEEGGHKRPRGRPRKYQDLVYRSRIDDVAPDIITNEALLRPKKTSGRGRPPKVYPRLDGETDQEYLVRVARIQKKPVPKFTNPEPSSSPDAPKEPSKDSSLHERKPTHGRDEAARKYRQGLGLRDWSEVLGSAALAGFPSDVIARATQRCANLFGESMVLRTMIEAPFGAENADIVDTYQPAEVPFIESDNERSSAHGSRGSSPSNLGYHDPDTFPCPIEYCASQPQMFGDINLLRDHLKAHHQMTKEQINEYNISSDEEMDGAVHIDGFLKPEKRIHRGKDKQQRKRRRKGARESELSLDDETRLMHSD